MTVRPAVVIGSRDSVVGPLLWTLMVTNALRPSWSGDVPILDAERKGLLVPCKVRTSKVVTVMASRAERLGRLDGQTLSGVREQVRAAVAALLTG